jgi:hypothetical protein
VVLMVLAWCVAAVAVVRLALALARAGPSAAA